MQEAPDLSKIVSIIMQNPDLIAQISSLMKNAEDNSEATVAAEEKKAEQNEKPDIESSVTSPVLPQNSQSKRRRKELLSAMKPYLSEHRQSAIDSMSSILDIIDVMARKES